jgi:hypothetical protein
MSVDLDITNKFNSTFEKYPFLFETIEKLKTSDASGPEYTSRNFNLVSQKIDALLNASSIHDYILNFTEINSLLRIQSRILSVPQTELYNNIEFYLAGNTPNYSNSKALHQNPGETIVLDQELINPLVHKVIINDSTIEVESVRFSIFIEQLIINFGIELCIALSELVEPKRSIHNDNEFLEPIEFSTKSPLADYFDLNAKERKDASIKQGQRFYPKAWELYTDNKELLRCLSLHKDALQTAILLEPYFAQTNVFHRIFSQIAIPTTQRFTFVQSFFLDTNKLILPTPSLKEISRVLLIFRTFNSDVFKAESKIHELIIPALSNSTPFKNKYKDSTVRTAYFATMRNNSGSKF